MKLSILDHPLISERYFFPRREQMNDPYWVHCEDVKLSCFYLNKFENSRTVVFFHGNGETVSDYLELLVPIFEQMGINLFLAEYRGYSMSTGTPALKSMLGDVKHIVNAIGLPPQQLILYGRSIGSLYAVHGVQQFPDIAGLIIESGVALILERVLMRVHPQELNVPLKELEEATEKDFNHQQKLAGFNGKTLVLHAQHDSLVHVAHGKKLYDWAPEPKHIKIFEKGDHNDILVTNAEVYFRLIFEFIAQL